jgi:hypothetical protein
MQHHRMELSINELLSDAIARLLMKRDGVEEAVLRQLMRDVRKARKQALGDRAARPVAAETETETETAEALPERAAG